MAGVEVIVVDKAVSTEDLGMVNRDIHLEVARLEAMLNTLVENKVESLKADKEKEKNLKQRITSTSTTASSSGGRKHHHKGRHHHKEKRESSPRRKRHQQIICCEQEEQGSVIPGATTTDDEDDDLVDEAYDFLAYQEQRDLGAVACNCSCGCPTAFPDNQHGQIMKLPYDDYISITMDLPDLPDLPSDGDPLHPLDMMLDDEAEVLRRARRKRRRKRRKRRRRERLAAAAALEVTTTRRETRKGLDDDLPQRARWTIVATACLLLLMCLLLVGVTLRMAPIIDDMVRKENEELLHSLQRGDSSSWNTTSTTAAPAVAAIGAGK